MVDTSTVAAQLQARASAPDAGPGRTLYDELDRLKPQLQRALPTTMTAERFTRIAFTEVRRNPQLLEVTPQSFLGAVMVAAQLGLEPGPLGLCYLVPFRDNRRGTVECQFLLGYKGMLELARRSGRIVSIVAREVCENDEFSFEYGLNESLVHRPALEDRGKVVRYYGVGHFADGGHLIHVMSLGDIAKRRARSKAKDSGPWKTDEEAMSRKTVIRAMWPWLPMAIEDARRVLAVDEAVIPSHVALTQDLAETLDLREQDDETSDGTAPVSAVAAGAGSDGETTDTVPADAAEAAEAAPPADDPDLDPVELLARAKHVGYSAAQSLKVIQDLADDTDWQRPEKFEDTTPGLRHLFRQHFEGLENPAAQDEP